MTIPFEFMRLQFPICLSFSIVINKSQRQTLMVANMKFVESFSHEQFYVEL